MARYPSHFTSKSQPESSKGLSTSVASMGWMTRGISDSRAPFKDFRTFNAEDAEDTEETDGLRDFVSLGDGCSADGGDFDLADFAGDFETADCPENCFTPLSSFFSASPASSALRVFELFALELFF